MKLLLAMLLLGLVYSATAQVTTDQHRVKISKDSVLMSGYQFEIGKEVEPGRFALHDVRGYKGYLDKRSEFGIFFEVFDYIWMTAIVKHDKSTAPETFTFLWRMHDNR